MIKSYLSFSYNVNAFFKKFSLESSFINSFSSKANFILDGIMSNSKWFKGLTLIFLLISS